MRKLLTVEDNAQIAELIRKVAIDAGFEARVASKEYQFIPIYDEFDPDVIVLDILMPGMDGFEVLQFLKDRKSRARVIILSGETSFRRMAENMGTVFGIPIEDNISKPFRVPQLRATLQSIYANLPDHERHAARKAF